MGDICDIAYGTSEDCNLNSVPDECEVDLGPVIVEDPESQTVCEGESVTFTVIADGIDPLSYQWRFEGEGIPGGESSTYTIDWVTPANAGEYDVVVSDACGTVTGEMATLTVDTAPSIMEHPVGLTKCEGESATFTVVAEGVEPLSYQWRFDGEDIPGAESDAYTIDSVIVDDAGDYDVVVTNVCGSVASDVATLTVNTVPSITEHPMSLTTCEGEPATFTVVAEGVDPLSYQWRVDGEDIPEAESDAYTIDSVSVGDAGDYDVVVTNICGPVISDVAILTVNTAPSITEHPESLTKCEGESATFTVDATGTEPVTYQWRQNGADIDGATESTYTIDSVSMVDAGDYDVVVTNVCGSVASDVATLTVNTAPSITGQPENLTKCEGESATFTVVAEGVGPLSYQWRRDGEDIPEAESDAYTIDSVTPADAGDYDVVVTNICGSFTSDIAVLAVLTDTDCDDENPCTDDSCEAGACSYIDNTDPCDDGEPCTVDDQCLDGECEGTYQVRIFADVYPLPYGDGAVEGFDILCVLDAANDLNTYGCLDVVPEGYPGGGYMAGDIYPCDSPDGAVEGFDILAVLDAANDLKWCDDPCP